MTADDLGSSLHRSRCGRVPSTLPNGDALRPKTPDGPVPSEAPAGRGSLAARARADRRSSAPWGMVAAVACAKTPRPRPSGINTGPLPSCANDLEAVPRQRNTREENATIEEGRIPEAWQDDGPKFR